MEGGALRRTASTSRCEHRPDSQSSPLHLVSPLTRKVTALPRFETVAKVAFPPLIAMRRPGSAVQYGVLYSLEVGDFDIRAGLHKLAVVLEVNKLWPNWNTILPQEPRQLPELGLCCVAR